MTLNSRIIAVLTSCALLAGGCFGSTRYLATSATSATQSCVATCERGDDADECVRQCPGVTVDDESSCPAPSPVTLCHTSRHTRVGATVLLITGIVVVVGLGVLAVVATSGIGFIPN